MVQVQKRWQFQGHFHRLKSRGKRVRDDLLRSSNWCSKEIVNKLRIIDKARRVTSPREKKWLQRHDPTDVHTFPYFFSMTLWKLRLVFSPHGAMFLEMSRPKPAVVCVTGHHQGLFGSAGTELFRSGLQASSGGRWVLTSGWLGWKKLDVLKSARWAVVVLVRKKRCNDHLFNGHLVVICCPTFRDAMAMFWTFFGGLSHPKKGYPRVVQHDNFPAGHLWWHWRVNRIDELLQTQHPWLKKRPTLWTFGGVHKWGNPKNSLDALWERIPLSRMDDRRYPHDSGNPHLSEPRVHLPHSISTTSPFKAGTVKHPPRVPSRWLCMAVPQVEASADLPIVWNSRYRFKWDAPSRLRSFRAMGG